MPNKPSPDRQDSPDWRDPSCYEYTAKLTFPQWAWEFLRRNPKYRQDWERWGLEAGSPAPTLDRLLSNESPQVTLAPEAIEQAVIGAASWGLNHPLNPCWSLPPGKSFPFWRKELVGERVFLLNREHSAETIAKAPDEVVFFGLDLRLHLTPQIDFLKQVFKDERKDETRMLRGLSPVPPPKVTRPHKPKLRVYLRALDADALGIPFEEAAQVLRSSNIVATSAKKQHRARLQKAMELRDHDYRDLVRL